MQDGGIDAYFLDTEKKTFLLIQSKFRNSAENFAERSISADELVKMEIQRILQGESLDSRGVEFNGKIKELQKAWRDIPDHPNYLPKVIILANIKGYSDEQIRRLIDNLNYEIFDFQRTYDELVFPLCSGTYYEPEQIEITINLGEKEQSMLVQKISTKHGNFKVIAVYVPVREIGRILYKYKNSILRYNPRNYLSLSHNKVNQQIRDSITKLTTNDFAVFNNGITIICETFKDSKITGIVDIGQLIITNPQIINGGQTAYTLSKVYEAYRDSKEDVFAGKEVLLKAIITGQTEHHNIKFIEEISNATNQQSRVEEADRRSNEPIQTQLQKIIYEEFGYFYERKKGEFFNGLDSGYIDKQLVIDRYDFLRSYLAFQGQPRWARQRGSETLFTAEYFKTILRDPEDYRNMLFAYLLLMKLYEIDNNTVGEKWGFGLRYGKMAIITAINLTMVRTEITKDNIESLAIENIIRISSEWRGFEKWVRDRPSNKDYRVKKDFDYDNYYKGKTINADVVDYFRA